MPSLDEFLPMSLAEMENLGWDCLDILIVSGDAYVDHASFGAAIIGRFLLSHGYKTGIIAQPDWTNPESFKVMGRPRLFCGVTAGNLDSMLAHYTSSKKKRQTDAYSPGNISGLRPNYPTVVYTQMLKSVFPGIPVVLGGLEASMRRTAHYDFWENKLKPSILFTSKADLLIYGMGEKTMLEVAETLKDGKADFSGIRGTARLLGANASKELSGDYNYLPTYELCKKSKKKIIELTKIVEKELNPFCGKPLVQMHGERALVVEPPQFPLTQVEIDYIYNLPFTGMPHPFYEEEIPAWTMVKDSITVLRGCAGGCSFCSLGFHQGKFLISRSKESILSEALRLAKRSSFKGTISDLGGPTANLYGCANGVSSKCKGCRRPSCLYPDICKNMKLSASFAIELYRSIKKMTSVKHVFINSGIRMDVAVKFPQYIKELAKYHVSGHLKVAPEHLHSDVLRSMRKPDGRVFREFSRIFERENSQTGKEQYLIPYFIAGFPGCTEDEMNFVEEFLLKRKWNLQQVQSFIPLPMTPACAMYYSGLDYLTEKPIKIVKNIQSRLKQKEQLLGETIDNKTEPKTFGKVKSSRISETRENKAKAKPRTFGKAQAKESNSWIDETREDKAKAKPRTFGKAQAKESNSWISEAREDKAKAKPRTFGKAQAKEFDSQNRKAPFSYKKGNTRSPKK